MNNEEEIMKKKVEYFFKKQVSVHIKKKNGYFHNGNILEFQGDMMILDDVRSGAMPIYLFEIADIEPKREETEK